MPVLTQHRATPAEGADAGPEDRLPVSGSPADETVARALRLIEEGFLADHPLSALAERVGVSERHLRRLFRERLGATPPTLHRARRLCLARRLLTQTSLPIIEVALEARFGSVRRFNACFREVYRMAPREMRRRAEGALQRRSA